MINCDSDCKSWSYMVFILSLKYYRLHGDCPGYIKETNFKKDHWILKSFPVNGSGGQKEIGGVFRRFKLPIPWQLQGE